MREEFSIGLKKFIIAEEHVIYGKEEIPYSEFPKINMLTMPTLITNGVAQFVLRGKTITWGFGYRDRERVPMAISYANEKIAIANGEKKDYIYKLQAHTGSSLEVYEKYIILTFMSAGTPFANIAKGGSNGGKRINIADITAIQFKEPMGMSVGFIQFTFPGSGENKSGVIAAMNDENSIPVSPQNLELAKDIVKYIEDKREELSNPVVAATVAAVSPADEFKKFKELLDSKIITQEEFEEKKKQLLGL